MATSHQLSVLTNSSVKPPLNPVTGLSSSLHERPKTISGRFSGVYYDDYDEEREGRREVLDTSSRPRFATADQASAMYLSNLSDDEFYEKLLQLKNDQRKLLQKCEQMYIEKHQGVIEPTFPSHISSKEPISYAGNAREQPLTHASAEIQEHFIASQRMATPPLREDRVTPPLSPAHQDLQSSFDKPPTGRFTHTFTPKAGITPKRDLPPRPSSAPLVRGRAQSLDELRERISSLQKSFDSEDEEPYVPDDTVSEPYKPKDISLAMSRIEDMWDNFQIEDYVPKRSERQPRVSSATITRREKQVKEDNWRHRLTVPEPFHMTLRDEKKEKKKTKTQIELERQRLLKEMEIDEELSKKFKATPVPAHVYLPLYDEIMEQSESRRRHVRAMSEELLRSQEKPFNFTKREADKKQHQLMKRQCSEERKTDKVPGFKAKAVPNYIFDKSVDDKLMEEEEYRKIRMKMRSEELLRSASLPPNMEARQRMQEQKKKEEKMKAKKKSRKSYPRPKSSHDVPNYDALYRQFQTELQRRKNQRESTIAQPFRLETRDRIIKSRQMEKTRKDRENENLKENRWPYNAPKAKARSLGKYNI